MSELNYKKQYKYLYYKYKHKYALLKNAIYSQSGGFPDPPKPTGATRTTMPEIRKPVLSASPQGREEQRLKNIQEAPLALINATVEQARPPAPSSRPLPLSKRGNQEPSVYETVN
jgi:hypothetical protein